MLIKFFLKTFLIIFPISIYAAGTPENVWTIVKSPVSTALFNCTFPDSLNGWAAGEAGIIIHTSDGGNSFHTQNTPVNFYTNDIFFINKRNGWAVANEFFLSGSIILKTTNGGINWTADPFPDTNKVIRTIFFLDSLTGFAGSFSGNIFKTTNSGQTWFETYVDSSEYYTFPVSRIKFFSNDTGFACGGQIDIAGVIWKTTDGGLNWTAGYYSPEPFYDLYFRNSLNVIAAGGDFEYGVQISTTSDCGINWNYQSLELFGQARGIDFRTPREAWMPLAFAQTWAYSGDSGNTWISFPATGNSEIYSVDFADSLHGLAVGNNGIILKYNGIITNLNHHADNVNQNEFYLYQNYPNPFNPSTEITYFLKNKNFVSLKVFDILGRQVAELVSGIQNQGLHKINFTADNLPGGIYVYRLSSGSIYQSRRMLLLK